MKTNYHLGRRTFLRGAGVALSLPLLDCMGAAAAAPKRFLALYVGHGFAITLKDDHPARDWSWYPRVADGKMVFGKSMEGFNRFTGQTTVLHGLEHPRVIRSNGHGTADSEKLDHYLDSVREVEKDVERMEAWAEKPKPRVSADELSLAATVKDPAAFIRTMYKLIYLAFQTDTTRYASYMLQSMGGGEWNDIPKTIGLGGNHHSMAHGGIGNNPEGGGLARYDKFQADLMTEFIGKLADTPEAGGTMLDNTIVYYGCSNSKTHVNRDYPLLLFEECFRMPFLVRRPGVVKPGSRPAALIQNIDYFSSCASRFKG